MRYIMNRVNKSYLERVSTDCVSSRVDLIKKILESKPRVEFAHCEHCGFSWLPFGQAYQDECPKCGFDPLKSVDDTDEELLGVTLSDDEMY
jgi:predicted Zn-ribbon and HTH transcriptional regulator